MLQGGKMTDKRQLNDQEKELTQKNVDRLKGELLEAKIVLEQEELATGIMEAQWEYTDKTRDFNRKIKRKNQEDREKRQKGIIQLIEKTITTSQDQIDNGVEIKEKTEESEE